MVSLDLAAYDPDGPTSELRFELASDAPAGAAIDPITGRLQWRPTEAQGPGTFVFHVQVVDAGEPRQSSELALSIVVAEVNERPQISTVPELYVNQTRELQWPITASDEDLPANALRFSLSPGAVEGATVDEQTGQFRWQPSLTQAPGTYSFTVVVSDDGIPAQTTQTTFVVHVSPPWQNPRDALDVVPDGVLAPVDALAVINHLNQFGSGALPVPPDASFEPPPYLDPSGDNQIAPLDALLVINALNSRTFEAEGEAMEITKSEVVSAAIDLLTPIQAAPSVSTQTSVRPPAVRDKLRTTHTVRRSRVEDASLSEGDPRGETTSVSERHLPLDAPHREAATEGELWDDVINEFVEEVATALGQW